MEAERACFALFGAQSKTIRIKFKRFIPSIWPKKNKNLKPASPPLMSGKLLNANHFPIWYASNGRANGSIVMSHRPKTNTYGHKNEKESNLFYIYVKININNYKNVRNGIYFFDNRIALFYKSDQNHFHILPLSARKYLSLSMHLIIELPLSRKDHM